MLKNKTLKIKTIILLSILFMFISILAVTGIQFFYISKLAISATEEKFNLISKIIKNKVNLKESVIYNFIDFTVKYPDISKEINIKSDNPTIALFIDLMKKNSDIFSTYLGYPNGDFFEIINVVVDKDIKLKFNAPEKTKWIIIKISQKNGKKLTNFVDKNFKTLSVKSSAATYDPRVRPWYKQAMVTNNTVLTDPYVFSSINKVGITYAKQIKHTKIVLGIDFSYKSLANILNKLKFHKLSDIVIFDKNGLVLVSTTKDKLNKVNEKFFEKTGSKTNHIEKIKINGKSYLIAINRLKEKQFIGVSIPYFVIIKNYKEIISTSVSIVLILILSTVPIIIFFAKRISQNTKSLMLQNKLVAERKFDEVKPIDSYIEEFRDLSVSLSNMAKDIKIYQQSLEDLFDAFIKMTADAIDIKSKYTGNHCKRVPEIAIMLAEKVDLCDCGSLKDFKIDSKDSYKEIEIAAWLHDCGKLTTPEFVVDKSVKLETIYNRIHEIRTRFEVLWRDIEIKGLEKIINGENKKSVYEWIYNEHEKLKKDFEFIAKCNIGDNFVSNEDRQKLYEISKRTWKRYFDKRLGLSEDEKSRLPEDYSEQLPAKEKLLDDKQEYLIKRTHFDFNVFNSKGFTMEVPKYLYNFGEIYNLSIPKGTLTEEERFKINEHIIASIQMLENLPFPKELKNVPEYAGAHHEQVSGGGYPRSLKRENMSVPARILAVADIFEALTATDRPYKKAKKLSESLKIMMFMAKDGHIDKEIYNVFVKEKVYMKYALKYLDSTLIDDINSDDFII